MWLSHGKYWFPFGTRASRCGKKSGYALEYRKSNIKQPRRMRMLNVNFAGGNFSRVLDTFFPLCYNTWQSNEGNDCLCSDFTTGRGVMDCERLEEAVNRRTFRSWWVETIIRGRLIRVTPLLVEWVEIRRGVSMRVVPRITQFIRPGMYITSWGFFARKSIAGC